jgi:very-short-patch-repair endonuclease
MSWQTSPDLWQKLKPHARDMRLNPTRAEDFLWQMFRARQLGVKFRRQHTVGRFILDFYSAEAKLCVELDGGGHAELEQRAKDRARDEYLESSGILVFRVWNNELLENPEGVLERLRKLVEEGRA